MENTKIWKIYILASCLFFIAGIINITEHRYIMASCFILLGFVYIAMSIINYKKRFEKTNIEIETNEKLNKTTKN